MVSIDEVTAVPSPEPRTAASSDWSIFAWYATSTATAVALSGKSIASRTSARTASCIMSVFEA